MNLWTDIKAAFAPSPTPRRNLCVLPLPAPKIEKGKPGKKQHGVIDEEVTYNERGNPVAGRFGFLSEKEADREGAERWLTGFDKSVLRERPDLWGGKKVTAQNERCKALWADGETVAQTAKTMRLSPSWVEKRFAAFGAALSLENAETVV